MHDNKEKHVDDKCPCDKCLVFPSCQNRKILSLMKTCNLLYAYLSKTKSSGRIILDPDHFDIFCELMGISTSKRGGKNINVRYRWEKT